MVAAEKWIATNSLDSLATAVEPYFQGMSKEDIVASLEMDKEAFSATGIVTKEGHQTAVKVFTDAGIFTKPVPFKTIVDNSFTQNALNEK